MFLDLLDTDDGELDPDATPKTMLENLAMTHLTSADELAYLEEVNATF